MLIEYLSITMLLDHVALDKQTIRSAPARPNISWTMSLPMSLAEVSHLHNMAKCYIRPAAAPVHLPMANGHRRPFHRPSPSSMASSRLPAIQRDLLDVQQWLPVAALPTPDKRVHVQAVMSATLPSPLDLRFNARLDLYLYTKLREILDDKPNKLTQLVVVLMLHYGNDPDDVLAHEATIRLYLASQKATARLLNLLIQEHHMHKLSAWSPATGPPWPGAIYTPAAWDSPFAQSRDMLIIRAGSGSTAKTQPYSDDPEALIASEVLASVLSGMHRAPAIHDQTARGCFQAWISYPDLLLRGLASPHELDERRCIHILHCLTCAAAMMHMQNLYSLDYKLIDIGIGLLKRDLPAVLDAIALHPEWSVFSLTSRLALQVRLWLPPAPNAVLRPAKPPREVFQYQPVS